MRWIAEARERLRGLFFRSREEAEMDEEMRFHLEMEAQQLAREEGLHEREARRRAAVAFGGMERYKEEVRDARGLAWVTGASLDLRLGVRMLGKYPGLTLVGGVGMAVAIAIGAAFFAFVESCLRPTLPLDEGERVVAIESRDAVANDAEPRILHDFAAWRTELKSVEELGAYREIGRNLIAPDGRAEPVRVAEMTASGFRVARVPPLLGRPLVEEDERKGAPEVVVIGYDVWRTRFAGDRAVVGRTLQLGDTRYTVVGVMPAGFAFPVNFGLWTPLRANPSDYERRQGPAIQVFGRLAPGVTPERAQAELTEIGRRAAAAFPRTHAQLRPRIVPYTAVFSTVSGGSEWELNLMRFLVSMLLVLVAVNVAILVYARTATRRGEIAVRSALGASRRRIVGQLFLEALVLSAGAAAVGLGLARVALEQMSHLLAQAVNGPLPFWMHIGLTPGTVVYVAGLAVLAAVIAGVVPGIQATGHRLESSLRGLSGGTGMQLGRTWTVLIVGQVAFAVAVLPAAVFYAWEWARYGTAGPGFPAEEFLTARLLMDRETPPSAEAAAYRREFAARFGDRQGELARRLEAEPGVAAVAYAAALPGEEPTAWIEVEGVGRPADSTSSYAVASGSSAGHEVRFLRVDRGFFGAFDTPILAGRPFGSGDFGGAATAVVVNRSFARRILGSGNALGRRIRYVGTSGDAGPEEVRMGRWYEIVGVVGDLPANALDPASAEARVYHPLAPGQAHPASLVVRMRGVAPAAFAGRLRELTAALDPTLQVHEVLPLDEFYRQGEQGLMRLGALAMALLTLSVLLLSAAGIYALMSFTVTRRRREIGIRAALGADPRRILGSVFSRAAGQLAVGLVTGAAAAALLAPSMPDREMGNLPAFIPAVAALMLGVGLLAALGPARRGLRIQPMEALREE